jgi:hypothetical protein
MAYALPDLSAKSEDELLVIANSNDYRAEVQAEARRLLLQRGTPEDAISKWREPLAEVQTASWLNQTDVRQLRIGFEVRRTFARLSGLIIIICLGVSWIVPEYAKFAEPVFMAVLWFQLLVAFLWRRPCRFLVLRRFNRRMRALSLRRFIKRNVAYHGHTYSLADNILRTKPRTFIFSRGDTFLYSWLAYLLAFRREVRNDLDLQKLSRALRRRLLRNLNWVVSIDKLFKVSVDSGYWHRALELLATAVDVIIVDVSEAGSGLVWEMQEIKHYQLSGQVIFVSTVEAEEEARQFVRSAASSETDILLYQRNGKLICPRALDEAIVSALRNRRQQAGQVLPQ